MAAADIVVEHATPAGYDLVRTLSGWRMGAYDPTLRIASDGVQLARQTPDGPSAFELRQSKDSVRAEGYGPGASWLSERVEELCGLADRPGRFAPSDRVVSRLARKFSGTHLPRTPTVFNRIVQIVLLQLVTWPEACRAWGRLATETGEPAPGPFGLSVPPSAQSLKSIADFELIALGVLPKQARTILSLAKRVGRVEAAAEQGAETLGRLLEHLPGIGPWTIGYVRGSALADPDAVLVGDYNLPHSVAYALAGEPRADDRRMLELLEPFRGHRFRVIRLLWMQGVHAPRRGPREPRREMP